MNTIMYTQNEAENITEQVNKFAKKTRRLYNLEPYAAYIIVSLTFLAWKPLGMVVVAIILSVAIMIMAFIRYYIDSKKKQMTKEVRDLQSKEIITDNEAQILTGKIRSILL